MEKNICKLCNKSFLNGRALGGHMRSHMVTLQTPPPPPPLRKTQFIESVSSSSNSSDEEEKGLGYELRENPKKSFRLVDPEFSFAVDAGSSVVQDRESDAESSKNPSRRRSKRMRKSGFVPLVLNEGLMKQETVPVVEGMKKRPKWTKISKVESSVMIEPEPMSSVSDTSPEEDVALCLMMLSRGTWKKRKERDADHEHEHQDYQAEYEAEQEEEEKMIGDFEEEEEDESIVLKQLPSRNRGRYQCGTCKKLFKSYQALGGHRASHKKMKSCATTAGTKGANNNEHGSKNIEAVADGRIHECPVCFRVFGSGQALGGHKRSHLTASATAAAAAAATTTPIANVNTNSAKFGDNLIDLNLPAPMEDDDYDIGSQVELSAVSDADFEFEVPIEYVETHSVLFRTTLKQNSR